MRNSLALHALHALHAVLACTVPHVRVFRFFDLRVELDRVAGGVDDVPGVHIRIHLFMYSCIRWVQM